MTICDHCDTVYNWDDGDDYPVVVSECPWCDHVFEDDDGHQHDDDI